MAGESLRRCGKGADGRFDLVLNLTGDLFQACRTFCLAPEHQRGLGVRRADESPAAIEENPHPVDVDGFMLA